MQVKQVGLLALALVCLVLVYRATVGSLDAQAVQERRRLEEELAALNNSALLAAGTANQFFVEVRCWDPVVAVLHDFLSDEECDHIIELGRGRVQPSEVELDGEQVVARGQRSSSGAFLERGEDEVVRRIEERIAAATLMPPSHGESLYILNYKPGQHYDYHPDYFDMSNEESRAAADAQGGQRVATVLMYLTDVEMGGDTHFPNTAGCGEDGEDELWVKPKRGMAVWWHNTLPNGAINERSLHAGLPVVQGEKWSATRWIRERPAENA